MGEQVSKQRLMICGEACVHDQKAGNVNEWKDQLNTKLQNTKNAKYKTK